MREPHSKLAFTTGGVAPSPEATHSRSAERPPGEIARQEPRQLHQPCLSPPLPMLFSPEDLSLQACGSSFQTCSSSLQACSKWDSNHVCKPTCISGTPPSRCPDVLRTHPHPQTRWTGSTLQAPSRLPPTPRPTLTGWGGDPTQGLVYLRQVPCPDLQYPYPGNAPAQTPRIQFTKMRHFLK